jgi:hypothetical protein
MRPQSENAPSPPREAPWADVWFVMSGLYVAGGLLMIAFTAFVFSQVTDWHQPGAPAGPNQDDWRYVAVAFPLFHWWIYQHPLILILFVALFYRQWRPHFLWLILCVAIGAVSWVMGTVWVAFFVAGGC